MSRRAAWREELVRLSSQALLWMCAATISWWCALSSELLLAQAESEASLAHTLLWSLTLSFEYSSLLTIPLGCAHAMQRSLARRRSGAFALAVTSFAIWLLALTPAHLLAVWMTSGDSISAHALAVPVRIAIFLIGSALWPALWVWHAVVSGTAGIPDQVRRRYPRLTHDRVWVALGVAALIVLLFILLWRLDNYAFVSEFLLPASWFVAATLSHRVVRRYPRVFLPLACGCALVASWSSLTEQVPEQIRASWHIHHDLAAGSSDAVSPASEGVFGVGFDLSAPERFRCTETESDTRQSHVLGSVVARHVILISIDALRPDAVDWVRKGRPIAPALRTFRDGAVNFQRAVTTYPATVLSLGGAFTGYGASELLMSPTLPRSLFHRVQATFPHQLIILPGSPWFRTPVVDRLILQGTPAERIDGIRDQRERFVGRLSEARKGDQAILAWLHVFEPHDPYVTHPRYRFGDDEDDRYASEVAYVDEHLGLLFDHLSREGWFDDSLVIVFSDHGEALGERGYLGHHVYLNSWMTDIVLYARWPGSSAKATPALVDNRDIFATVLDIAGLPVDTELDSQSLIASAARGGKAAVISEAFPIRGEALFELAAESVDTEQELALRVERVQHSAPNYEPKVAVATEEFRYIIHRNTGVRELYRRGTDAEEQFNLVFDRVDIARELGSKLTQWYDEQSEVLYCRLPHERRGQDEAM